jgi:quercetin dioxygenase-like cupin family protein
MENELPDLSPEPGVVETADVFFSPDMLVKAFALGPGAAVEPHEHPDQTNAFHVLRGAIRVTRGDDTATVEAPGVVVHDPGVPHGAANESDAVAVFTATMAPMGD